MKGGLKLTIFKILFSPGYSMILCLIQRKKTTRCAKVCSQLQLLPGRHIGSSRTRGEGKSIHMDGAQNSMLLKTHLLPLLQGKTSILFSPHSHPWKLLIATKIWEWKGATSIFQMNHPLLKKRFKNSKIEISYKASDLNQNTLSILFPDEILSLYQGQVGFGYLS